jgi:uncharacterized protein YndB with AHSA1/START domain
VAEPLRLQLEVGCSVAHAFTVWTEGIDSWWPTDHTVSAEPGLRVVLEGRVGGRVYERTATGVEHDWGEVTVWEPPSRLAYTWFLRADRADATDVEITFAATAAGTRIDIEHRGWERLGVRAADRRDRNRMGWTTLLPHFRAAVEG